MEQDKPGTAKVSERMSRDANKARQENRKNLLVISRKKLEEQLKEEFERNRLSQQQHQEKLEEELEQQYWKKLKQQQEKLKEEFDELDYLHFYDGATRAAIVNSLNAPLSEPLPPLPPLDITTISYYRRLSKPIFQTRLPGCNDLDPHLTHESLHLLCMLPDTAYPNFPALTREFERDLPLYLSANSKDIHTMAVIAAGNRVIGREREILSIVQKDETAIWILFNHIFSEKISYETLLPYILRLNPIAFRAFYELSNVNGQESISWFFDKEQVVEALLKGLESQDHELRNTTLRIFGNVLGEGQKNYIDVLINSPFLQRIFRFLLSSETIDRKDGCWVLANYCSYDDGAIAVGRNALIAEKLKEMLYYEGDIGVRKEIGHIFNSLINQADKVAIFQFTASQEFLEIITQYLGLGDYELSTIYLGVLEALICLGDNFKNENEINVVVLMVLGMPELMREIRRGEQSKNSSISEACNTVLAMLSQRQATMMEGEC